MHIEAWPDDGRLVPFAITLMRPTYWLALSLILTSWLAVAAAHADEAGQHTSDTASDENSDGDNGISSGQEGPDDHTGQDGQADPDEKVREPVDHAGRPDRAGRVDTLGWSYLYDGGALPFFWLPLAGAGALELWVDPRQTPLLFSADEGGAPSRKAGELPGWQVTVGALAMNAYIALAGDHESRWFHAKGMAESLITTTFITNVGKRVFGRHRPDYVPGTDDPEERKSFPSGHSSITVSATTYFVLYLRYHGFDRFRRPGTLPWWEGLTYGALAAAAVYVPYTRVRDNRHHRTDVTAGSLIGGATSLALFYWQDRRYRRAAGSDSSKLDDAILRPILVPDVQQRTLWLCLPF